MKELEDIGKEINNLHKRREVALERLEEIEHNRKVWQKEIDICNTIFNEHCESICNKIIKINSDLLEMREKRTESQPPRSETVQKKK